MNKIMNSIKVYTKALYELLKIFYPEKDMPFLYNIETKDNSVIITLQKLNYMYDINEKDEKLIQKHISTDTYKVSLEYFNLKAD